MEEEAIEFRIGSSQACSSMRIRENLLVQTRQKPSAFFPDLHLLPGRLPLPCPVQEDYSRIFPQSFPVSLQKVPEEIIDS